MNQLLRALLALLLACAATQVQAEDFDYYVLSLSLAPAFCEMKAQAYRPPRQCAALTATSFRATPLTLHGLWPDRRDGRHPDCAPGRVRGGFCRLSPVPVSAQLAQALDRYMPGRADCLDRHEWAKHGACTGLSAQAYFGAAVQLTQRAERALGPAIVANAGQTVPLETLRAELERSDPALRSATQFDCRTPRGYGRRGISMLTEVRIYFERGADGQPGRPLPLRALGRDFNSGCRAGRAYVDAP